MIVSIIEIYDLMSNVHGNIQQELKSANLILIIDVITRVLYFVRACKLFYKVYKVDKVSKVYKVKIPYRSYT